jgi:hypothetical protein
MPTGGRQLWTGACHCRRTRFEFTADIRRARVCNCSICRKRGALIFRVGEDSFRLLTPLGDLGCYEWGTGTAKDYFCRTCGILPFRRPRSLTAEERAKGAQPFAGWAVNLRCVDGLDLQGLTVQAVDGASLPLPVQLP